MWRDLALLVVLFLVVTVVAVLLGAPNTGTAATFGQIAFAFGAVGLMLRGRS